MRARWLIPLLLAVPALARVGGGQDYGSSSSDSGGGYSGGGGGGGGDAQLIGFLIEMVIRLIIFYPAIGIPLLLVGLGAWFFYSQGGSSSARLFDQVEGWANGRQSSTPARTQLVAAEASAGANDLGRLRQADPNFSRPLFLDFVNLLYSKVNLLGGEQLALIGAYLDPDLRKRQEGARPWHRVIVGGLRVLRVQLSPMDQKVIVEVEANLEGDDGSASFVVDELVLQRKPGVMTPAPEAVYSLACPNCGNTAPVDQAGRCTACDNQVNNGRFGWLLTRLNRQRMGPRLKVSLSSGGEEAGTDMPTLVDGSLEQDLAKLISADPEFSLQGVEQHARHTFLTLQQAWTEGRWELARPLESDFLFGQHQMWMEAYAREGLRNVLEEIEVRAVEPARIELDRYFESVTLRIFARMKDSTIRLADGQLVSGDPKRSRSFSEYWTFIRRAGVTSKQRESVCCPNCGAPLDRVTVAGVCEYCDANITRGDFDWVLSRIEQDEAYSAL